jgi:plasmid stabilization system protein ParE
VSRYLVELAPAAEVDIADAFLWYRDRNAPTADAFRAEVFDTIDRIEAAPLAKGLDEEGNRKRVLHRFPYSVIWPFENPLGSLDVSRPAAARRRLRDRRS